MRGPTFVAGPLATSDSSHAVDNAILREVTRQSIPFLQEDGCADQVRT